MFNKTYIQGDKRLLVGVLTEKHNLPYKAVEISIVTIL
jgi:hypothetical protein